MPRVDKQDSESFGMRIRSGQQVTWRVFSSAEQLSWQVKMSLSPSRFLLLGSFPLPKGTVGAILLESVD
jgi:hypothetical protein